MRALAGPSRPLSGTRGAAYAGVRAHTYLLGAVGLGVAFGSYFVLRYLGFWTEQDTEVFVRVISDMQAFGNLRSPGAYTHGYAYPVWATTLANFTGLGVAELVQLYTPLVGNLLLAVFGYACFRRLLASDKLGLAATAVLFLVPELVFTMSRGNHEKLTVALTLFAVLALLKSFLEWRVPGRRSVFYAWTAVYHLSAFTLATLNIFFGSSLIVALTVMLVFTGFAVAVRPKGAARFRPLVRRLARVVVVNWFLVVLVIGYVYPQTSGTHEVLLESATERLGALLGAPAEEEESFTVSDPYAVGTTDWSSLSAYRLVSSFRWLLFAVSFATWLSLFVRAWVKLPELSTERLFLLALYGSFGFVLALAVPIDFLNLSAGTNLQVRMYTYFVLLAAPVFALALGRLGRVRRPAVRALVSGSLGALCCVFGVLSLLKATLDPMVSNRWLFYHPAEVQAARFWDERHEHNLLWLDVEGRLRYAYITAYPEAYPTGAVTDNALDFGAFTGADPFAVRSRILEQAAVAWHTRPPPLWREDRLYDNGAAQLYHRVPRTPFQQ